MTFKLWSCLNYAAQAIYTAHAQLSGGILKQCSHYSSASHPSFGTSTEPGTDHTDMATLELVLHAKHRIQSLRPSQSEGHCRDQARRLARRLARTAFSSTAEHHRHGKAVST